MTLYRRRTTWWAKAMVHGRLYRESLKTTNKSIAIQRHAMFMERAETMRSGHLTSATILPRPEPVHETVRAFLDHLDARNTSEKHRREVERTLRRFLEARNVLFARQLQSEDAERWLVAERRRGLSARTINKQREHLRAYGRWLERTRRHDVDPFAGTPRLNQESGRTYRRRALTIDEARALLDVSPLLRRVAYYTVMTTGLRRSELASLLLEDLDLDAAIVRLRARSEKARRGAIMRLHPTTVDLLRELQERREEALRETRGWARRGPDRSAHVFPSVPAVRTLYRDLRAAGIEHRRGEVRVDFHALRKTFGTMLATRGVPLVVAQRLLRHSTPELTANIYTEVTADDERAALERLPIDLLLGGART